MEIESPLETFQKEHGCTLDLPPMPLLVPGPTGHLQPSDRMLLPSGASYRVGSARGDQAAGIDFMYVPQGPADAISWQIKFWESRKHYASAHAREAQELAISAARDGDFSKADKILESLETFVGHFQQAKAEIETRQNLLAPLPPPPEPRDEERDRKLAEVQERIRKICAPAASPPPEKINIGPALRLIGGATQNAIASEMFVRQHGAGTARALGILPTPQP